MADQAERGTEPPAHRSEAAEGRPRILIIRPSALGDVARSVPALVTLRHRHPEAHIDWLVHEAYADVVRPHPALDGVVLFPRGRFAAVHRSPFAAFEFISWIRRLRAEAYDIVIDLQGLFRSGLFTRLTGAERRVGYANARELAWLGYNHRHRVEGSLHSVDRMLALLECEGYEPLHDTQLYVDQADLKWLDEWRDAHLKEDLPYACVAPTAKWGCKCWPIERFAQAAQRLLDSGREVAHIVVLAGPDERERVQPLIEHIYPRAAVSFPSTTVGRMMALISRARLVLCNDSAALHVAVGFGRPAVGVFGPTDPALVGPYRRPGCVVQPPGIQAAEMKKYRRRRDDPTLISRVSVDQVWERLGEQLSVVAEGTPRQASPSTGPGG